MTPKRSCPQAFHLGPHDQPLNLLVAVSDGLLSVMLVSRPPIERLVGNCRLGWHVYSSHERHGSSFPAWAEDWQAIPRKDSSAPNPRLVLGRAKERGRRSKGAEQSCHSCRGCSQSFIIALFEDWYPFGFKLK